ncbi:unnamed protein product [Spirodela intermedia]|uniref:RNase H type-1 domain-containing protein n=1 Tax=Spirodela intermedia TaxID=51605 RepID=A0ABN7E9J8_SPIIN|nr:unnamed protein product [Spirodela intermedia]
MHAIEIMRHVTQWLRSTYSLVPNKRNVRILFTTIRSVRWTPSKAGRWKLNVDGASQDNSRPSGGGGILRDSVGCIFFAFSNLYNIQTNIVAEAMAIRDGLLLCEEQNITNIILEFDSKVLVDILRADSCPY